jgi:hypothetical protein
MSQLELFEKSKAGEKKFKEPLLPRRALLKETFSRKVIEKTRKEHVCARCGQMIPAGSRAMEIIPKEGKKRQLDKVEYYHLKETCPAWGK